MPSIGTYAGINARVRTLRSTLLTSEQYFQLIQSRDSHEFHSTLSQMGIGRGREDGPALHNLVEASIYQDEINRLRDILKGSRPPLTELINLYLERFDLMQIKAVLRQIHADETSILMPLHSTRYEFSGLSGISTPEQLAGKLMATPYGSLLNAAEGFGQKFLFPLETAMDRNLFGRTAMFAKSLDKANQKLMQNCLGLEIDLLNLSWISRFRENYRLSWPEIEPLLLTGGRVFNTESMTRAIEENSFSELLGRIVKDVRIVIPEGESEGNAAALIENVLIRALYDRARASFMAFPFSIGATIGYVYMLKNQTRNLLTVLNALVYEVPAESVESLIIV